MNFPVRQAAGGSPAALEMPQRRSHNGTGTGQKAGDSDRMPTLFRLLVTLGVIAGLVYGAMFALATYVEPRKGEMTVRIPPDRLNRAPQQ